MRAAGLSYKVLYQELQVWLPRVHLECNFHRPAQLDDLLSVTAQVKRLGNSSLTLAFEVRREAEVVAQAGFTLVAVDRVSFVKVPLPRRLREQLEEVTP